MAVPITNRVQRRYPSILLGLWLFFAATLAIADTYEGRVVSVADGDTITVLDRTNRQHKIRLMGIDAPEKSQPFGQASKRNLSRMVFGKHVTVTTGKSDRYRREIAKVTYGGQDINLEQINAGLAWHYKQYERDQEPQDRLSYERAEELARFKGLGLWADDDPVPPWEFRKRSR